MRVDAATAKARAKEKRNARARRKKMFANMAQPIGELKSEQKVREHNYERRVKAEVREEVWRRSMRGTIGGYCDACGKSFLSALDGHLHEDPPRSKTRGLPVEERFNLRVCSRVHPDCHEKLTRHEWVILFEGDYGFQGQYSVDSASGEIFHQSRIRLT